jgi:hypothetical protein
MGRGDDKNLPRGSEQNASWFMLHNRHIVGISVNDMNQVPVT